MAAAARIGAQGMDQIGDLVDALTRTIEPLTRRLECWPVNPLLAIDRAQIAPFPRKSLIGHDAGGKILARDLLPGGATILVERPVGPDLHPCAQSVRMLVSPVRNHRNSRVAVFQ
jgi:hypothetical protein